MKPLNLGTGDEASWATALSVITYALHVSVSFSQNVIKFWWRQNITEPTCWEQTDEFVFRIHAAWMSAGCSASKRHLESGHLFRFAPFAVRSCSKLTLTAEELFQPPTPPTPSFRSWSLRIQRDKDTGSSTLHCITAIILRPTVCLCSCVLLYMHCMSSVQAEGRWGEGVTQVLTFNLHAHKSCGEHAFTPFTSLSPRLSLLHGSMSPNTEILKINRLLVAFGFLHFYLIKVNKVSFGLWILRLFHRAQIEMKDITLGGGLLKRTKQKVLMDHLLMRNYDW